MINHKGMSQMWWLLAMAALAILVVILFALFFRGTSERGFDSINNKIGGLNDADNDLIADFQDKCPCVLGEEGAIHKGCPKEVTDDNIDQYNYDTCK
jgi:hypothetical protein